MVVEGSGWKDNSGSAHDQVLVMKKIATILICLFTASLAVADDAYRPEKVGALARLAPHNGVYTLAAPSSVVSARVSEMPVREGQRVKKGDAVAIMDMANIRRLDVGMAKAEVAWAKVDAAEKKREFDRRRTLFENKSISQESFNDQHDTSERAQIALEKARLNLKRAEALFSKMIIRSPIDGMVLAIYAREGEAISETTGIARIGDIDHMEAVAEVYETDIKYVKKGQSAIFKSPALGQSLAGTVTRIAPSLTQVEIYSSEPMPNTVSRIVKVYITLKDSALAARFINLQGTALIDISHKAN